MKNDEPLISTSIRLPAALLERFKDTCYARRVKMTTVVIDVIAAWLSRDEVKAADVDLSALPHGKQVLVQRFIELDVRDQELALRLHGWWRAPGDRTTQKVIKPGVALSLGDEYLLRQAELQQEAQ